MAYPRPDADPTSTMPSRMRTTILDEIEDDLNSDLESAVMADWPDGLVS